MSAARFPVYQIDFVAAAAGKRVASTKRRIRWRFGFPNQQALDAGQTGTDCRGEEHDVTVIWSITSGKRQISMDGREIHFSNSRAGILDFSWTTKGNHVIKVECHAAAPLTPEPNFRQYDLFIDGQSFFNMPKMFELGVQSSYGARGGNGYSSAGVGYTRTPTIPASRQQEEEDLQRAIAASLEESRRHLQSKGPAATTPTATQSTGDLLGFDSPAPSMPPAQPHSDARSVSGMSYYSAPPPYTQASPMAGQAPPSFASPGPYQTPAPVATPGALVPSHGPPGSYYQAPPATPSYASPPPVPPAPAPTPQSAYAQPAYAQPAYAQPAPAVNYMSSPPPQGDTFGLNSMPGEDPFAPKPPPPPTAQDFQTAILGAYQAGPPVTPTAAATGAVPPGEGPVPNGSPAGQPMSMNALTNTATEEAPMTALEKAMRNLVNVDHIDEPAEGEIKLTMIKKEEEKKKTPKNKSVPLPPVATKVVGSGATLSQIKSVNHGERTLKSTVDGVMNAPPPGVFSPGAAAAGALVVHGQGPPPLNQPMGFGLGARMPNGGFAQQQPSPMGYQQQQQYYQ